MTDNNDNVNDGVPNEMLDYLQVFLEEIDEELDSLVEALLKLETDPDDVDSLNEAFRLLHSLKGSSGMMGYLSLSELAHKLENRFEAYRKGEARLDRNSMDVILDCVDFIKLFSTSLRSGEGVSEDATHLIERLETVELSATSVVRPMSAVSKGVEDSQSLRVCEVTAEMSGYRARVTFEKGLQLADVKARLILARLSSIGEVIESEPSVDDLQSFENVSHFSILVLTSSTPSEVMRVVQVDGVEKAVVEFEFPTSCSEATENLEYDRGDEDVFDKSSATDWAKGLGKTFVLNSPLPKIKDDIDFEFSKELVDDTHTELPREKHGDLAGRRPGNSRSAKKFKKTIISETVRVETNRLDRLMNLTGELIVTKARFAQIATDLMASIRESNSIGRIRYVSEQIRQRLDTLKHSLAADDSRANVNHSIWQQLEEELLTVSVQSERWKLEREHFRRVSEAVDQLTRVSDQLQRGVLDMRMVPIGPLFKRFKRVVRDLSLEFNKQVRLEINGEQTELDKRMIDELGDPLLHLVRNSLDHGLESLEDRLRSGKPEIGTVSLEASHIGNNVVITISDDGAGLNLDHIRASALNRKMASPQDLEHMSDSQVCEFIWHPGFSTAEQITDISGRGVGMDIVKRRIDELKGTVEVQSAPGRGTQIRVRLPLTLAIIHCLLVRFRSETFSIPIADVREVVALSEDEIFRVHQRQTIDVRGEFIPLISISTLFEWNHATSASDYDVTKTDESEREQANIVILKVGSQTLGLRVDKLIGGADLVVKSLSENFIPIKGLSGASIMGDGSVCLLLDTSALIDLARQQSWSQSKKTFTTHRGKL